MNVDTFLEQFGHLADAPDGIKTLKKLILELAISGRLVEQDPAEESAQELLNDIIQEQKTIGTKKESNFNYPSLEDKDLPFGWKWCLLGQIQNFVNGFAFPSNIYLNSGVGIIRIGDIQDNCISQTTMRYVHTDYLEKVNQNIVVEPGDLVIAMSGATTGKLGFNLTDNNYLLNQRVGKIATIFVEKKYVFYFLTTKIEENLSISAGSAIPNLSTAQINNIPVPLPPLAEQKRIVDKVDELMALCDALEMQQQQRQTVHGQLTTASLHQLTTAETPRQLTKAWQRIDTQFDQLFTTRESIEKLRQTILQLAVQGKLVPQDPEDEPAERLVSKISLKKQSKNDNNVSDLDGQIQPYSIPSTWVWSSFNELGELSRGKSRHRPRNAPHLYDNGLHPLVQTGDVARSNGTIKTYSNKYNEAGLEQSRLWKKGTLCITIAANIADTGILGFDACIPDSVVGFVPHELFENARYFEYFMRTAKKNLEAYAPSTAQKNINLAILSSVAIPLPPLNEQNRIVAKVDQMMTLCDQLESDLEIQETDATNLTTSMTSAVLINS